MEFIRISSSVFSELQLCLEERPGLLSAIQSALGNQLFSHRSNVLSSNALTEVSTTPVGKMRSGRGRPSSEVWTEM